MGDIGASYPFREKGFLNAGYPAVSLLSTVGMGGTGAEPPPALTKAFFKLARLPLRAPKKPGVEPIDVLDVTRLDEDPLLNLVSLGRSIRSSPNP